MKKYTPETVRFTNTFNVVEIVTYNHLVKEHIKYWATYIYDPNDQEQVEPLMFKDVYNWAVYTATPQMLKRKVYVLDHGEMSITMDMKK